MLSQNYKTEYNHFREVFHEHRRERIVLYGLGRHTVSLLPVMQDFNFVGLMDRDAENVGRIIYGVSVITEAEAEENADIIIINTAEAYWETIYNRIKHLNIPIYYRNGQRARSKEQEYDYQKIPYWKSSFEELRSISMQYEIISFDIFDTLIMRRVYSPTDIFRIMDLKLKLDGDSFSTIRNSALALFDGKEYTLDELYDSMSKLSKWSETKKAEIKKVELETEESSIVPRTVIIGLLLELQRMGKEIYLISDMYLAKDFIIRLLEKYGITISAENILLSGELGVSKKEGELWSYYKQKYVKQRSALHIGDNYHSDIENAEKEGISTYYIMKASEILNNSSLNVAEVHINGLNESVVIGMLCAKLFENPFCLNNTKGTVNYQEFEVLGYCWFGNVIITYLLWLQQQCVSLNIDQIIFLARDGFLLLEDYQFLMNQFEITDMHSSIYLPISRRLILIAAISDEKSFHEAISFPYIGRWEDYLFDRFDINILPDDEHRDDQINASADEYKIKEWLRVYSPQLQKVMNEEKVNYLRLLDGMGISENAGVVDVGYYGNTQHYLNRLLNQDLAGFYFSADLSIDNKCYTENRMFACFQSSEDMKANSCSLHKQSLVIESFLTAPYGMIKKIDTEGNCIYEPNRNSQSNFQDRLEMNEGVKAFIKDYSEILSGVDWRSIKLNTVFADKIYGILIENKGELSQKIKDSFYWDNGVVQRRESKIFE